MEEAVIKIPHEVMSVLTGNVDVALFVWSFVVAAWVVLVVAVILGRTWKR